jgi:hypothetical protein
VAQIDGGQDVPENLRPRCRSCNSRRGAERGNGGGGGARPSRNPKKNGADTSPSLPAFVRLRKNGNGGS